MYKRLVYIVSTFVFIGMLSQQHTYAAPADPLIQEQTQIGALNHTLNFQVFNTIPSMSNTLFASAGGSFGCPHIVNDRARQGFYLPVTAQLISDMGAALASGGIVEIGFRTRGTVISVGSGVADYRAKLFVVLRRAGSGRVILMTANEMESAPPTDTIEILYTVPFTPQMVNMMNPGDHLLVGGGARGTANSVGCETTDQATVQWEILGYDSSPNIPALFYD